jgi:hypothetical protein
MRGFAVSLSINPENGASSAVKAEHGWYHAKEPTDLHCSEPPA